MKAIMNEREQNAYANHLVQAVLFSKGVVDKAQSTIELSDREQEQVLSKVLELTAQDRYYYLQEHEEELSRQQEEEQLLKNTKIEQVSKQTETEDRTEETAEEDTEDEQETEEDNTETEQENSTESKQMTLEEKLKAKLNGGD